MILLIAILWNPWGWGGYVSIILLILPDLASVFLHNQQHQMDNPGTFGNGTMLNTEQEILRKGYWASDQSL